MAEFKVKLLTSRVTVKESLVSGDSVKVGNDEAWRMEQAGIGEVVGKSKPKKPKDVEDAEKVAATEAEKLAEKSQLKPVHPEGVAMVELHKMYEARIAELEQENTALSSGLDGCHACFEEVAKVYDHVTGGRISKPNTEAAMVITEADDVCSTLVDEAVSELRDSLAVTSSDDTSESESETDGDS